MVELLAKFVAQAGDFEFACERQGDQTCIWTRKLLNFNGATPEKIRIQDVPTNVLEAFAQKQVGKQVQAIT
jgi:hypothetical protein